MDKKTLERYLKVTAKAGHPSTPPAEAKAAGGIAKKMEIKHPELVEAAEAFRAAERAQRQASEQPPDYRDPQQFQQAWETLFAAMGAQAASEGEADTVLGNIKAGILGWMQTQGQQLLTAHMGTLADLFEAELALDGGSFESIEVDVGDELIEYEGDPAAYVEITVTMCQADLIDAMADTGGFGAYLTEEIYAQIGDSWSEE